MCRNILTRVSKKDTVGYLKTSMAHRKDVVASIRRLESTCRALETPGISSRTLSKGHHFGRISRNNRPSVLSLPSWRERLTFVALVLNHPRFIRLIRPLILECLPAGLSTVRWLAPLPRKEGKGRVEPLHCFSNWKNAFFLLLIKFLIGWKIFSNRKSKEIATSSWR